MGVYLLRTQILFIQVSDVIFLKNALQKNHAENFQLSVLISENNLNAKVELHNKNG